MFRFRNLLPVGIAVVMMAILTAPWVSAQPFQQATATPEVTTLPSDTPAPTIAATDTVTSVAPAVSPLATPSATPAGTPSTLPTTGGSDDGSGALSLLLIAAGAVILVGLAGLRAVSRRSR